VKNKYNNCCKIVLLILVTAINGHAQKLPNVQVQSVRAPAIVKIDGKPTEWGILQAYNHATEIFYTMANDDENLYLVVQATDQDIINRIMGGGVTLHIQPLEKNTDNEAISVKYPVLEKRTSVTFILNRGIVLDTTPKIADSVMAANNKRLEQFCRWITVKGIKGLDTLSVYNEDHIKAVAAFNNRRVYTFELSISLKQLGCSQNNRTTFSYHITLDGLKGLTTSLLIRPTDTPEMIAEGQRLMVSVTAKTLRLSSPTDFGGKYTLALK